MRLYLRLIINNVMKTNNTGKKSLLWQLKKRSTGLGALSISLYRTIIFSLECAGVIPRNIREMKCCSFTHVTVLYAYYASKTIVHFGNKGSIRYNNLQGSLSLMGKSDSNRK